jgi:hypothetical protein
LIDETTLLVHFSNANDELINIKEWMFKISFNANIKFFHN